MDPRSHSIRDLLKYHKMGGWIIPWMLVFPKLSRSIAEGLGGVFMPAISTIVPVVGSIKFVQKSALGIIGK
jgi:hypothetical protein